MEGMTTVTQGTVGLGSAIAYFCSNGYTVSLPIVDNQDYDLIVDIDGKLNKIQVKTSKSIGRTGKYEVQLKSVRSNKTSNIIKYFDKSKVEYLYILLSDGLKYLIPSVRRC